MNAQRSALLLMRETAVGAFYSEDVHCGENNYFPKALFTSSLQEESGPMFYPNPAKFLLVQKVEISPNSFALLCFALLTQGVKAEIEKKTFQSALKYY
jgi:hypothetical protein